jgi:D-alanyl-D-alanine carboxypeptidase
MKALPEISAKCWGVFDGTTSEIITGRNYFVQAEIASLTKIMTCYVVLQYLESKPNLDWNKVYFEISKSAESCIGTSARLVRGH